VAQTSAKYDWVAVGGGVIGDKPHAASRGRQERHFLVSFHILLQHAVLLVRGKRRVYGFLQVSLEIPAHRMSHQCRSEAVLYT
jgi:hypothetical protein